MAEEKLYVDAGRSYNYHNNLKKPLIPSKTKYLEHPEPVANKNKNYKNAENAAPNKDKPTTADAQKGLLSLPSVMASVDPQGLSVIAPQFYSMAGQIYTSFLAASSSGSSGSSTGSTSGNSSSSTRTMTVQEAFTEVLFLLANKYTFNTLTLSIDSVTKSGGLKLIDIQYQDVVKNATATLYVYYAAYGNSIPTNQYSTVVAIGTKTPSPIVTTVPDFYTKQYYTIETDPYPGYVQWLSPDGKTSVYTVRQPGDIYYTSPLQEVTSEAVLFLYNSLEPYITTNTLTAAILNDLLRKTEAKIQQTAQESTGGSSSSSSSMDVLMKLAGYLGVITQLQQTLQLPFSVLNSGSIVSSQTSFLQNMALIKQQKTWADQAMGGGGAAGLLGAIGSVAGAVGSVASTVGASSLVTTASTIGSISSSVSSVASSLSSESIQGVINSAPHVSNLYNTITS